MRSRRAWTAGFCAATSAAILTLAPAGAAADAGVFKAKLSGAQEVPPNPSAATGFGRVTLNGSETLVTVSLTFTGLGSNQIAAHIHGPAGAGVNGPVIFNIGSTGATAGTFTALVFAPTAQQVADLRNGLWYFNVHSVNFAGGEIRGQIYPDSPFIANLNGLQEVPPAGTGATGIAGITLNEAETQFFFTLSFTGLGSNQTASHIHGPARPGVNASIQFNIGSSGATSGTFTDLLFSITPTQVAQLKAGWWYVNVHSTNFPAGEIRGQLKAENQVADFDADGRAEVAVYRDMAASVWYTINPASFVFSAAQFGTTGDQVTPGDFDGDGKTDLAVWRGTSGTFYAQHSGTGNLIGLPWGTVGDDPQVAADFDGDGRADFAVWRPGPGGAGSQAIFHVFQSSNGAYRAVPWGLGGGGDVSVSGDYDGDRKADFGVYRTPSWTYYVLASTQGFIAQPFGVYSTDLLVPGDYDGDTKTDFAVYRRTVGAWYVLRSSTGTLYGQPFGAMDDIPVPADYDGDGKTDVAVARVQVGQMTWYIWQSATQTLKAIPFGATLDYPIPKYLVR
jgi:hypothetical protein